MYNGKSVAVVIPAYKEETQIGMVVLSMPDFVDKMIVVDDASPDRTAEVVRELQASHPRLHLIVLEKNEGVGGAIAAGYKWARDNDYDVAVVMAGDGQMDPDDLPAVLDPVVTDVCDYTKGNRLFTNEAFKRIPKVRFIGNSILSFLTKVASGYWHIFDSQSGYTAINKRALKTIDWDKMYKRYGQPNDLLVRLNVFNFRVKDVAIRPVYNVGEQSKMKVSRAIFTISTLLLRMFLWRMYNKYVIRDFHPLVLFYGLGSVFFVLFAVFMTRLLWLWSEVGQVPEITFVSTLFCFAFGLQSLFFAMWFDMDYNRRIS